MNEEQRLLIEKINKFNTENKFDYAIKEIRLYVEQYEKDIYVLVAMGNALYGLKKYDEALVYYKQAVLLDKTDTIALTSMATIYYEQAKYDQGVDLCFKALNRDPDNERAMLLLGNFYYVTKQFENSLKYYEKALSLSTTDRLVILSNLSKLCLELGFADRAEQYSREIIENEGEDDIESLYILGQALEQLEKFAEAAQIFLTILKKHETTDMHVTLGGCLYNMMLKGQDVYTLLDLWLDNFPENPIALHTLKTIENEATRASADYVKTLFDAFADCFDEVLEGLQYHAPTLIAKKVTNYYKGGNILDLGCGTGLCGFELSKLIPVDQLDGVDLSEKMIKKAQDRRLYHTLDQADISVYQKQNKYSMIISADVLTYLGDLKDVFKCVFENLISGGYFIFSVSKGIGDKYEMEKSGRFVHSEKYIKSLLNHRFEMLEMNEVVLRKELNEDVQGLLFVLKKKEIKP